MLSGTLAPRVLKSPRQKEGEKEIRKGQKRGKGEKGQGKEGERDDHNSILEALQQLCEMDSILILIFKMSTLKVKT